jgi:5-methylcytosine-specific restriction protein B
MPTTAREEVGALLKTRRYVIIQGPPGTGKTRMARQILTEDYRGMGQTIQFHPNTTYESFVGGLAPVEENSNGNATLGFRFAPKRGFLIEAAVRASQDPSRDYLLHIDEINRADLAKILGEAIYLFEPDPEYPREINLAYDFGKPILRSLRLPNNLHVLGTMNSADRSIAILDIAVRRRFAFLSLWPSLEAVEEHGCTLSQKAFQKLVSTFIEHAGDEALPLVPGHSYFLEKDEQRARKNLKTNLVPLLSEYLAQGYVSGFAESIRGYLQWLDSL